MVEPRGTSSNLAMLWKKEVNGNVGSYSQNRIDLVISTKGKATWRLTSFYGLLERVRRR